MKLTRSELISKATECANTWFGNFKTTDERHVRDAIVVYFAVAAPSAKPCIAEVELDVDTGEVIRASLIPDASSVLHAYLPEHRPDKPNPN
jgi:hypothetical protein